MAFLKINGNDYSMYCNKLVVGRQHNAVTREAATGLLLVKRKATVRLLEIGFIALDNKVMPSLMVDINKPNLTISFLDPLTNELVENMPCMIATNLVDYYTIQGSNAKFKAFTLSAQEIQGGS